MAPLRRAGGEGGDREKTKGVEQASGEGGHGNEEEIGEGDLKQFLGQRKLIGMVPEAGCKQPDQKRAQEDAEGRE